MKWAKVMKDLGFSFKPCYKWNTFNTDIITGSTSAPGVLNLVISGIPSIQRAIISYFFNIVLF